MLPLRDQAFDDDFAYIQSVQDTVNTNHLHISEWSSASLVFLVFWGSLFAKLFGFSSKILHLSTVILLFLSLAPFYLTLRRLKLDNAKATFFTLALFLFPWVYQFTYTFLTDVPFMSLLIISTYFYVRGIQDNKNSSLVLGSLFAAFSFLTRQIGIVIPASMLLTFGCISYQKKKIPFRKILYSLLPFILIVTAYTIWLIQPGNTTIGQSVQANTSRDNILIYLLPANPGHIRITNDYYIEFFHRIPYYLQNLAGFSLVLFFAFKFKNLIPFLLSVKTNFRIILLLLFLTTLFYIIYKSSTLDTSNHYPLIILGHNHIIPFYSTQYWDLHIRLAFLTFLPILAVSLKKGFYSIFSKRSPASINISFKLLVLSWIVFITFFQINVFTTILAPLIPLNAPPIDKFLIYSAAIFSSKGVDILSQSWLVIIILSLSFLATAYVVTKHQLRPKIKHFDPATAFIFSCFIFELLFLTFLMYGRWGKYIICMVPLFIIWIAYATRDYSISRVKASLVILFFFVFTLHITKDRYGTNGIYWQLGAQLVAREGVQPIDIESLSWAWLPWWYYRETLAQEVVKLGGNKYLLNPREPWVNIKSQSSVAYNIVEVDLNFDPKTRPDYNILIDTGPIYSSLFHQRRFVAIKYPKVSSDKN